MKTFVTGGYDKCHISVVKWDPMGPCGAESLAGSRVLMIMLTGCTADGFKFTDELLAGGRSACFR